MKKPTIYFHSRGETGNIFCILVMVRRTFQHLRRINDYNDLRDRVTASGSYDKALAIIREYVELIDLDGQK